MLADAKDDIKKGKNSMHVVFAARLVLERSVDNALSEHMQFGSVFVLTAIFHLYLTRNASVQIVGSKRCFDDAQRSLKNLKKCKREKNLNINVSLGENVVWYVTARVF